jgi:hypothetical protein
MSDKAFANEIKLAMLTLGDASPFVVLLWRAACPASTVGRVGVGHGIAVLWQQAFAARIP